MLRNTHNHASALVTTLFVLVVLCTITVAFLQTMTMERAVSRSLKNKFKADLAAEAGANMVAQAMTEAIGTRAGFLVLSTNISPALTPIFYIQTGSNDAASNVLPLVSGDLTHYLGTRSSSTSALTDYLAQATNTNNAINANRLSGPYPILANSGPTNFNAPWIHFTNANGETNSRVAFFVVDEQSKLNLAHHGWSTNTNRACWSNSPSLVPIAIPGNTNLLTTIAAVAFASATNKSHFVGNLPQVFSDRADYESKNTSTPTQPAQAKISFPADTPIQTAHFRTTLKLTSPSGISTTLPPISRSERPHPFVRPISPKSSTPTYPTSANETSQCQMGSAGATFDIWNAFPHRSSITSIPIPM